MNIRVEDLKGYYFQFLVWDCMDIIRYLMGFGLF